MSSIKSVPQDAVAKQIVADSTVGAQTINGTLTGAALGLLGCTILFGVLPSQPAKSFSKLLATYVPLTTLGGASYSLTNAVLTLNNAEGDVKRASVAGCVAGSLYGIHKSSLSSACLGCLGGAALSGGAELKKGLVGVPSDSKPLRPTPYAAPVAVASKEKGLSISGLSLDKDDIPFGGAAAPRNTANPYFKAIFGKKE